MPGVVAGARLANPYVVTYDGIDGGVPTWVDHAPGGVDPAEATFGADYVAGSCGAVVGGVSSVELGASRSRAADGDGGAGLARRRRVRRARRRRRWR